MLSTHDVTLRNVDGSLFHVQIWFVVGHQDQNGQNWRNISQFTMWLSQSSVNVYQTYQSLYQLGGCPFHGRVERDEIPTRESPPKQSGTLPCPALPSPPLPSPPLPSPPLHSRPLHSTPVPSTPLPPLCLPAEHCPSQCTPFVRLASWTE